jgi:hypothetical protein
MIFTLLITLNIVLRYSWYTLGLIIQKANSEPKPPANSTIYEALEQPLYQLNICIKLQAGKGRN